MPGQQQFKSFIHLIFYTRSKVMPISRVSILCSSLLLALLSKDGLHAQSYKPLSLVQIISSAANDSPELRGKQELVNSAREDIRSIRSSYLPTAVVGDEVTL